MSQHDASGAITEMVHPMSLKFLQAPVPDGRQWFGEDLGAARSLTVRYLSAWSAHDGRAVAALYAPRAMLLDSLLGVRLTGRDAIGSYAVEHAETRLRLDAIPDDGGPALYGFWREYGSPITAYLTYTGEDGKRCPGGIAAQLQIEHGRSSPNAATTTSPRHGRAPTPRSSPTAGGPTPSSPPRSRTRSPPP